MSDLDHSKGDVSSSSYLNDHLAAISNTLGAELLRPMQNTPDIYNLAKHSHDDGGMPNLSLTDGLNIPDKITKPGDYSQTIKIDGIDRHYNLYVPTSYDPSKALPLEVVLHGHGGDADGWEKRMGIDAEADKKGFAVAYLDAIPWLGVKQLSAWDTGNGLLPPGDHVDDVGFMRNVIDRTQSQMSIDKDRTYLVGYSNGGMEAYKAAGELSDKIAAVVDISGAMSGHESKPKTPVSMLSIAGTEDKTVPLTGRSKDEEAAYAAPEVMTQLEKLVPWLKPVLGTSVGSDIVQELAIKLGIVPELKPLSYATEFWKGADGIKAPGISTHDGPISTETYTDPKTGVTVEQEIITGGDHMVQHGIPANFNLADETWKFLEAHPKHSV